MRLVLERPVASVPLLVRSRGGKVPGRGGLRDAAVRPLVRFEVVPADATTPSVADAQHAVEVVRHAAVAQHVQAAAAHDREAVRMTGRRLVGRARQSPGRRSP